MMADDTVEFKPLEKKRQPAFDDVSHFLALIWLVI